MAFLSIAARANPALRLLHLNGTRLCPKPALITASGSIYQARRFTIEKTPDSWMPEQVVSQKITGAIIPFSQQAIIQQILFPYTYSLMYTMDFLLGHMPWWAAIVVTTSAVKVLFLPLMVMQQKLVVRTHNILPQSQKLQAEMNEALASGDHYRSAMARAKLGILYKEHNLDMFTRLKPVLIQAPMFMSIFFLLRKLTSEVESMKMGGALWFTDLTVPDPLWLLPLMTSTSLWLLLETGIGAEGASGGSAHTMGPAGRWIIRAMPVGLFFFIQGFPAGTLLFWTTNNFLSLVTALMLKNKAIMKKLKIPEKIKHDPASLPLSNQTLSSQFKKAKELGTKSKSTLDLRRLDDMAFKKAGVGPLRKTYKTPPTPQDNR